MALIKQMIPEYQQAMTSQTGENGFTLMELLVVIGIIIVIAAAVLTVIPGLRQKTQEKATKAFMERLEVALEQYYDDNRSYPSGDITDVKTALQSSDSTEKQYIEFDDSEVNGSDIVDYWGNPFVYDATPSNNTGTYDLYSTGVDGATSASPNDGNDADDINNWSR
jgi:general secretion pathway protein G